MFIMDSLCCSTMVYFFLLKAQLKKKNYVLKWPQHTSSNQISDSIIFFFTKCKKAIVLYDKVVDFLGWERKVILCKKGFFPSCCFVEQKKS